MEDLQKIKDILLQSKKATIISHYNPDGDAIGSQIALGLGLKQLGIDVSLINKDRAPNYYSFLADWESIKPLNEEDIYNTIVCVDCATMERTGYDAVELLREGKRVLINIDHHISNTNYADYNWVDHNAAATAELIYDLLGILQVKIDKDMANALYTGISTDTGSFLYENTTSTTHIVVSDLINRGADVNLLRLNYYENTSMSKIELVKHGLNNLSFAQDNKIAWITIGQQTFLSAQATDADAEGLINYVKGISGVEIAITFREIEHEKIKVSFRSKSIADVNELAAMFSGGGHPRASGCIFSGNMEDAVAKITSAAVKILAQGG
ncbi:MAG: DHH family phosphoesterase [Bacillota bacterium]